MDIGEVFQYINSIPDVAVYALVDENIKTVYINHSTKLRSKIGEISDLMHQYTKFEYFSISSHPVYKLIMAEQIRLRYINEGYKISNQRVPFIKFKVKIRLGAVLRAAFVYIESSRGHKEIVGVFSKVADADSFVSQYYSSGWSGAPVYAVNEGTREYLLSDVYKRPTRGEDGIFVESNEMTQTENEVEKYK